MQALQVMLGQLAEIWKQLGLNQKVIIVASGLAVAVGLAAVMFFSSRPDYALLYGRLDSAEAGKIIAALDEAKTPYQAGQGGGAIYVPRDKVHVTRMSLAAKGLPKSDGVGYEIFDKPSFGMSDFVQRANYLRALQGELARTISQIEGVESSRVMIVAPENRLIVDPNKKPTASVFVKLRGIGRLEQQQVGAIRFLVASSVEGLKPNHVSVVDNFGNALSESDDDGSLTALTSSQLSARRNLEKYLSSKVESLLEKVVGPGQAIVRVSAEVNHDQVNRSSEFFDPKGAVERMTRSQEETSKTANPNAAGTPGTTTNANTDTNTVSSASLNATELIKRDNTKEYAISRATTNVIQIAGEVKRITAAVFVNKVTDATGKRVDRTTEEVEKLRRAVQNALGMSVGQDATRRDEITLEEVVFNDVAATQLTEKFEKDNRTQLYWEISKNVMYGLLALGSLFLFWKLAQRSAAELIPTGVPVGQLLGGQFVYQGAGDGGMVMAGMGAAGAAGGAAPAEGEASAKKEESDEDDVEIVKAKKQKLVMDFGLSAARPERVTIEVLKDLIRDNPNKMTSAARNWLSNKDGR